jgi:glycosyltransferase involved in cell wall biosynthesis
MPRVSVVIPTYNRPDMLGEAVASVLAQTYRDFELLIVDDGSDPPSRQVVESVGDPRVHYRYQENAGRSAARNAGIALASGEYVAFLDDDDLWLPEKLAFQLQVFAENPDVGLIASGWNYINAAGAQTNVIRPWLWCPQLNLNVLIFEYPALPSVTMVRRDWAARSGGFDVSLPAYEDWDLGLRLSYLGCPMAWGKEVVASYRLHADNTVKKAVLLKQMSLAVLDKFFAQPGLPERLMGVRNNAYARAYLKGAAREYAGAKIAEAQADLVRALELNPTLAGDNFQGVFNVVIARAADPTQGDPLLYVATVMDNLPPQAGGLAQRRTEALKTAATLPAALRPSPPKPEAKAAG